jgi:hypothetical protein
VNGFYNYVVMKVTNLQQISGKKDFHNVLYTQFFCISKKVRNLV